jgi:hypothetical protein
MVDMLQFGDAFKAMSLTEPVQEVVSDKTRASSVTPTTADWFIRLLSRRGGACIRDLCRCGRQLISFRNRRGTLLRHFIFGHLRGGDRPQTRGVLALTSRMQNPAVQCTLVVASGIPDLLFATELRAALTAIDVPPVAASADDA